MITEDEFAHLFELKGSERDILNSKQNRNLAVKLLDSDAGRFEKLYDTLAQNGMKFLPGWRRNCEAELKAARKRGKAAVAKRATQEDGFQRDENGNVIASQANIRRAIERLGVRLRYDSFRGMPIIEGLDGFGPPLDDYAMARLWLIIDETFKFRPTEAFFRTVATDACMRDRFHPVCDYMDALEWDGTGRIDTWLVRYFGAEDTPFNRAVGRLILIAAVRRVRSPGCKFDEALILESEEGFGKSSALAMMAVHDDWFTDSVALNVDDKKMMEGLGGKWLVELAELQGMRKADIARLKAQLSRNRDRARLAYGRLPIEQPRQSIFIGTVNPDPAKAAGYLASLTGNRRFWPVAVGAIDLKALRRDRDQLWAEASVREAKGESIRLDAKLWPDAQREQEARQSPNPLIDVFAKHLAGREGVLFSEDAWELTRIPVTQRASHYDKFGAALKVLGWERRKRRRKPGADQEYAYVKGDEAKRIEPVWDRYESRFEVVEMDYAMQASRVSLRAVADFTEELTES